MTCSSLATVHIPSPNRYWGRAFNVTKITPHHMGGDLSVESCGWIFEDPNRQASSNYGIGSDGRIACYVDEDDAAWTSADWDNDNRAITFEIADWDHDDWSPTQAAWDSTVALCVDICQRYGIPELVYTGGPDGNLTEHLMFAPTACPGPWWHANMQRLADEVNAILRGDDVSAQDVWNYGLQGPNAKLSAGDRLVDIEAYIHDTSDPTGRKKEADMKTRVAWMAAKQEKQSDLLVAIAEKLGITAEVAAEILSVEPSEEAKEDE